MNDEEKVNVGTAERPVMIDKKLVTDPDSGFWRGVATGSTLSPGVKIDTALSILEEAGEEDKD
ncbi:MAG: hypothetical protein PVJ52_01230 [Candidatus Woesebacteria bacterium]|jgi:hypothetical protein